MQHDPAPIDSKGFRPAFFAMAAAMGGLTVYLGYFADRSDFQSFLVAWALFFALYVRFCFFDAAVSTRQLVALGIGLRILLLFSLPNLSDDYLRFIWDGRLILAGYHPFLHPPDYFIQQGILPPGITPELYARLNSPHYHTVYPPVCQAIYVLAAWVSAGSERLAVVVMKLFLLGFECGTIALLQRLEREKNPANTSAPPSVLYALNPLLIVELTGNLHFEGAMGFFLLAGLWMLRTGKLRAAAGYWSMAVATKLLPLLFLPLIWRWLGWKPGWRFMLWFGVFGVTLFAPLLAVIPNMAESVDLYFREFQFNASWYYVVRIAGFYFFGWDIGNYSGPALALASVAGVLLIAWFAGRRVREADQTRLYSAMVFTYFLYLSLSAVVQPWYLTLPLLFSLLTPWRFVLLWSGLVTLSYSHYDGGLRQEHYGLITLEYVLVWAWLLWERVMSYER